MKRMRERINVLERSNMRLRGALAEERERTDSVWRRMGTMTITCSGMTPEAIEEMITRRVTEALVEQESNRNLGPIVESESENGDDNENRNGRGRRNGNGGRGNGGRNGNNGNNNNGNGDQGGNAVELELLPMSNGALTWWNAHKRTIGTEAAYALTWTELMKLMTEDAVRMANSLMDQNVRSNAVRQFDNKKK
ncbi:putative reverse transcriptase domain-containing protein, partial [Tanacetum coccineum]